MLLNEITKSEGKVLRKTAQDARTKSDVAQWEQAKALHAIYYSGYSIGDDEVEYIYKLWGYENWHDYVESEIGIHVGKANVMVQTAHFFVVKMGKDWNKQILSPTRMRTLAAAKQVTGKNLNAWITKARNMTPCQLDHELLGHNHNTKSMGFKFSPKTAEIIKERLEFMKREGGYATLSDAMESLFIKRKGKAAA